MKKYLLSILMLIALSMSGAVQADSPPPSVPPLINFQSLIFDANGNITTQTSVNLTINILDSQNNVVYTENQSSVPVTDGAINVSIGEASPTGGIPLSALDPSTGQKSVDVMVSGSNPFDVMPLTSVPYALWAQEALTVPDASITSQQIKPGSITAADLDPGFSFANVSGMAADGQIPSTVARAVDLQNHINSTTAHLASSIVVNGNFVTFVATNVEQALEKIDGKLADEIVNRGGNISTVITDYQAADTNLQGQITTLGNNLTAETTARTAGDANLQTQVNTVTTTANTALANAATDQTAAAAAQTTANAAVTAAAAAQTTANAAVMRSGDTMTGDLNISMARLYIPDPIDNPNLEPSNPPANTMDVGQQINNLNSEVATDKNNIAGLLAATTPDDSISIQQLKTTVVASGSFIPTQGIPSSIPLEQTCVTADGPPLSIDPGHYIPVIGYSIPAATYNYYGVNNSTPYDGPGTLNVGFIIPPTITYNYHIQPGQICISSTLTISPSPNNGPNLDNAFGGYNLANLTVTYTVYKLLPN